MTTRVSYIHNTLMAFIDILGFEEMVKSEKDLEELILLLNDFMAFDNSKEYQHMKTINTRFISDSLVIWISLDDSKDVTCFIVYIGSLIANIHKQGNIFVRGCIGYGNHYNDEERWISPVFIEAYRGEKCAKMPRVTLSKNAESAIATIYPEFLSMPWLERDQEGVTFLNHMNFISGAYIPEGDRIIALGNHPELFPSLLRHKNNIESNLKKFPGFADKYQWLADMHNTYVKKHVKLTNKQELLIKKNRVRS